MYSSRQFHSPSNQRQWQFDWVIQQFPVEFHVNLQYQHRKFLLPIVKGFRFYIFGLRRSDFCLKKIHFLKCALDQIRQINGRSLSAIPMCTTLLCQLYTVNCIYIQFIMFYFLYLIQLKKNICLSISFHCDVMHYSHFTHQLVVFRMSFVCHCTIKSTYYETTRLNKCFIQVSMSCPVFISVIVFN